MASSDPLATQEPIIPFGTSGTPDASSFLRRLPPNQDIAGMTDEELVNLMSVAASTLRDHGSPSFLPPSQSLKVPDVFDNVKYEQIACAGLKPHYDGSPQELMPTLNAIHIRRQNEAWYPATFILQDGKELDLIRHFSRVHVTTVLDQAKLLWDVPESMTQRHTHGTKTYNSRLFALFLTNSITPSFASLLHSQIDPKYCNDGPLLLLIMCLHIHRNHLPFVESV
jgi:hypothetical protein